MLSQSDVIQDDDLSSKIVLDPKNEQKVASHHTRNYHQDKVDNDQSSNSVRMYKSPTSSQNKGL